MKKLILMTTVLTLSFSPPVYAMNDGHDHDHGGEAAEMGEKAALDLNSGDAKVAVNGLVCDFCARALEKVFGKQEAVNAIDVNLDTKIISVSFNDGQTLDDEALTGLITDAGYNVESIDRVE